MRIVYGKDAQRFDITHLVSDLSWSSTRGQLAQTVEITVEDAPPFAIAGYLMLFAGDLKESQQIFHGTIVSYGRNEKTSQYTATAYELSWYLTKNETSRIKLNGDAGKELERVIRGAGVSFSCPSFGFAIKERMPAQSFGSLLSSLTDQAYEKTGIRYFLSHRRDRMQIIQEGGNTSVPVFAASSLQESTIGQSLEEVYTVVTVERYKDDNVAASVTKQNDDLIRQVGRMTKVIDAGEEKDLAGIATRQPAQLARVPRTRTITVNHENDLAAFVRSGWAVQIVEPTGKVTDWICTSARQHWKGGSYVADLELESR